MKVLRLLFIFLLINSFLITLDSRAILQEVKTEVILYDDYFGHVPLPENAIELETKFSFNSLDLQHPVQMANDTSGNIYFTDETRNVVLKFDSSGEYLCQFGKRGKGKGEFLIPQNILLTKDFIIVHEIKNRRIQFLDLEGNYIKSFKIYKKNVYDIAINENGLLFVAKSLRDKDTSLVDVFSPRGKLLYSFGKLFFGYFSAYGNHPLNSRKLALNKKGELFVASAYFPIVRKYSQKGGLLAEYKIENNIMLAKEKMNLKLLGKARRTKLHSAYAKTIIAIKIFENKIYLLGNYPRLEILEINEEGKIEATYWKDCDVLYKPSDFLVQKIGNQKRFYVLQSAPDRNVDVFGQKHK